MEQKRAKWVEYDSSAQSYCALIYSDDDESSGYGDNARECRWYGSRAECEAVDPYSVDLYPMKPDMGPDPFDLACERRYD